MSFLRDCWESVRGNFRDCMTTPLSRKKLLIFGGVFLAVVLLVIILVFSLRGGSGSGSSKGSDAINDGLTFGGVDSSWLKTQYGNKISEMTADDINKQLQERNILGTKLGLFIWSVGASNCTLANQKDAVSQTLEGIDAAIRLASAVDKLTVASDNGWLEMVKSKSKVGMMIALDGGYTLDSRLAVLRMFYNLGARILTLTGSCSTPWAGNWNSNIGLSEFGKNVVTEANRLGIVVDLAGSSSAVITTAMDSAKTSGPILFNGIGASYLNNNSVNIGNDTIKALTGNPNNLVMVSFKCDVIKNSNGNCTADDVINHINVISQLSKRSQVGIAADFNVPNAVYPSDLQNMDGVAKLFDKLHTMENGWSIDELKGLAYNNFYNMISKASEKAGSSDSKPIDILEQEDELDQKNPGSLTCYSDLSIRYGPPATPAPTTPTTPTASTTTATATTSTLPTVTTKRP